MVCARDEGFLFGCNVHALHCNIPSPGSLRSPPSPSGRGQLFVNGNHLLPREKFAMARARDEGLTALESLISTRGNPLTRLAPLATLSLR
jgi:hypothetical protein